MVRINSQNIVKSTSYRSPHNISIHSHTSGTAGILLDMRLEPEIELPALRLVDDPLWLLSTQQLPAHYAFHPGLRRKESVSKSCWCFFYTIAISADKDIMTAWIEGDKSTDCKRWKETSHVSGGDWKAVMDQSHIFNIFIWRQLMETRTDYAGKFQKCAQNLQTL